MRARERENFLEDFLETDTLDSLPQESRATLVPDGDYVNLGAMEAMGGNGLDDEYQPPISQGNLDVDAPFTPEELAAALGLLRLVSDPKWHLFCH